MRATPDKFVYFVRAVSGEGLIKIGCSLEPRQRVENLMCWSPVDLAILATLPGDEVLERRFHHMFRDQHVRHEWFEPSLALEATISRVARGEFKLSELPEPRSLYSGRKRPWDKVRLAELHAERAIRRLMDAGVSVPEEFHYSHRYQYEPQAWAARAAAMQAFVAQFPASMTTAEGVRKAKQATDQARAAA